MLLLCKNALSSAFQGKINHEKIMKKGKITFYIGETVRTYENIFICRKMMQFSTNNFQVFQK